jgi:hypothetical protein
MQKYYAFAVLFLFLCLSAQLSAQNDYEKIRHEDSTTTFPIELSNYVNYLKSYKSKVEIKADMDTVSSDKLKAIAKMMYEACEKDAVSVAGKIFAECVLSDSLDLQKWKYHKNVEVFAKPTLTRYYLYKKFREKLPHNVYPLIASDYLLKVKILSIKNVLRAYQSIEDGHIEPSLNYIEIEARIVDIIKGATRFSVGETLTFYYMPYWRGGNSFGKEEECFVLLQARVSPDFNLNQIGLLTTLDKSYGKYPIINGELIDKENYFGYGTKVQWNIFKNNLLELIKTIKSW